MDINRVITDALSGLDFGTAAFYIKKHDGQVSTVDTQKVYTHKVNNNQEALAMVIQLMKGVQQAKQSANMTFTVTFNKGEANKVMVQDIQRKTAVKWG